MILKIICKTNRIIRRYLPAMIRIKLLLGYKTLQSTRIIRKINCLKNKYAKVLINRLPTRKTVKNYQMKISLNRLNS